MEERVARLGRPSSECRNRYLDVYSELNWKPMRISKNWCDVISVSSVLTMCASGTVPPYVSDRRPIVGLESTLCRNYLTRLRLSCILDQFLPIYYSADL